MKKIILLMSLALTLFPGWIFGANYKIPEKEKSTKESALNTHILTIENSRAFNCGFSSNTVSNVVFGNSRQDAIRINTFTGVQNTTTNPVGYIIVANTSNNFTPFANNTTLPSASRTYTNTGQQVVHIGTTTNPNIIVNGLSANNEYFFKIYAYFDNCSGTGSQISYQQVGYTTSNYTSGGNRIPLAITYSGATSADAGSSPISLTATSANSTGFTYQLIETTTGTSLINNSGVYTLQPGEGGTVVIDIKAEGSTTHSTIHQTIPITISKTDPTLHVSTPTYTINDGTATIDLAALTTTNSAGAITYSILTRIEDRLGSFLTPNSTLNVNNTVGSIELKASQAATGYHNAKDFVFTTSFANADGSPITPAISFDNFSMPINSNQTLNAITLPGVSVNYSIVVSPTGAQVTGANLFSGIGNPTGGLPRVTIVKATTVATSNYVSATKNIEVSVTQATPIITFPTLSDKNTNDAPYNLSASSDAVTISTTNPNGITYTSSNTSVATVSGSTVTIVGVGTTTITANQTGNYYYTDAASVSQDLTVTDSSITNQTVNVSPSTVGNCITSASATVSLGSSQTNVQYTLRDNSDNSVIGSPIAGTGSSISFPAETLTATKTYNVFAQEINGSKTLVFNNKPSVTFNGSIQNQQVVLSQLNTNTARISLSDSESGISYYLRDNSTNTILQSMDGTGSNITFADQNFTGITTYNVLAVKTSGLNGQRNVLQLDGVNDFVKSGVKTLGNAALGMTVDTWVKIPSSDDTDQNTTIIGTLVLGGNPDEEFKVDNTKKKSQGINGESHNLYVKINNGLMYAGATADHVTFYNTTPVSYPKDQWIHIAGVRNANSIKLFINGIQVGIVNSVPVIPNPSADGMSVGAESNGFNANQVSLNSSNVLGGSLVNSRLWYAALNASQVATSMTANNVSTTGFSETLAIGYSLSQTSGVGITNVSGNANFNGTLNNGLGDANNWVQDYLFLDQGSCGEFQLGNTVTADPNKTVQNITFNALPNKTYGNASFDLSASSDSGLTAFSYTSSNTDIATISGNTVTILAPGTTTITANQTGNATYATATAIQNLTIDKRAITITTADNAISLGGTLPTLSASVTSGTLLGGHEIFIPIDTPSVTSAGNQTISVSTTLIADAIFDPNGLCSTGVCILNTTKDTNLTANYTITNDNTGTLIVSDPNIGVIWNGSNDTSWNNTANWSGNTIPNNVDIAIPQTSNTPNIGTGINSVVNDLNVQNSTLTISDNSSVIVKGNFTNAGNVTVNSQGNTSGVLLVEGTSTGTVTYERGGLLANKPSIISAPVSGQSIKEFAENSANDIVLNTSVSPNEYAIAYYDDSNAVGAKWIYYTTTDLASNTLTFEKGRSYQITKATDGAVTFTGTIDVANITKTVVASEWNAIGNPYTAFLPANENGGTNFIQSNLSNFDPSYVGVYIWDVAQNKYVANSMVSSTRSLAPGQGFFVRSKSGVTSMNFDPSQRILQPSSGGTFAKSKKSKQTAIQNTRVELTASNGTTNVLTTIAYTNTATEGLDTGYDIGNFDGANFDVFTKLTDNSSSNNFTYQSLPSATIETITIPVGIKAEAGTALTFSANSFNLPTGIKVFIEDVITGSNVELENSNSYSVTLSSAMNGAGRFNLRTQSSVLPIRNRNIENVKISNTSKEVFVKGVTATYFDFELYDTLGIKVQDGNFMGEKTNKIPIPNLKPGVYIVKLKTVFGTKTQMIVISSQ